MSSAWHVVAETRDRVGEGPLWMPDEKAVYWVDVLGRAINRLRLDTGRRDRWDVPEEIGFLVPRAGGDGFVAGLRSGLYRATLAPQRFELIAAPEPHFPDNRFNDGKADAVGRLWAGTMPMDGDRPDGALYCFASDGSWRVVDNGYRVANGPAFGPDQRVLYHADSPLRIVYRFDLNPDGGLSGRRRFITFAEDWGYPDGMTVDAEGFLWVAHWDGGRITRFDLDGKVDRVVALPASRITSCAFAGTAVDRLFVTSAREGREDEPLAGSLFEVEPGVVGLPPGVFAG